MIVYGEAVGMWVTERMHSKWQPETSIAIGQEKDGIITAGVIFDRYNGASISSTLAADEPLSREFVRAMLRYPFAVANAKCVINTVSSANTKSIRLTEHFGFKRVAVVPDAYPDGDMIIYSLTPDNCSKFLRE